MGISELNGLRPNPYAAIRSAGAQRVHKTAGYGTAKTAEKSFSAQETGNVSIPALHVFDNEEGDTTIGAWADPQAGTSVSVYQPKDFDVENPVYKVKIWDKDGNVEERMVDVGKFDAQNADTVEMYAYSCYLSKSGKYPDADAEFMMMHAMAKGNGVIEEEGKEALFDKKNWLKILSDIVRMQYDAGDLHGYLRHKGFLDYLSEQ